MTTIYLVKQTTYGDEPFVDIRAAYTTLEKAEACVNDFNAYAEEYVRLYDIAEGFWEEWQKEHPEPVIPLVYDKDCDLICDDAYKTACNLWLAWDRSMKKAIKDYMKSYEPDIDSDTLEHLGNQTSNTSCEDTVYSIEEIELE